MGLVLELGGNYMDAHFSQFVNVYIYTSNIFCTCITFYNKKKSLEKPKEEYIRQKFHLSGNTRLKSHVASLAWIKEERCHD